MHCSGAEGPAQPFPESVLAQLLVLERVVAYGPQVQGVLLFCHLMRICGTLAKASMKCW